MIKFLSFLFGRGKVKETTQFNERLMMRNVELNDTLKGLKLYNENLLKQISRMKRLINEQRGCEIRFETTDKDKEVLIAFNFDKQWLYLIKVFDLDSERLNFLDLELSWMITKEGIYIKDISGGTSIGSGTIAFNILSQILKERNINVDRIYGEISHSDYKSHGKRLLHFYEKNGFVIRKALNKGPVWGYFEKGEK